MRLLLPLLLATAALAAPPRPTLVDLTHSFDADTVYWPTETGFTLEVEHKGPTPDGWWYESNRFCAPEHGGTHVDAPAHFAQGRQTVDAIPLDRLVGPGIVVDVTAQAAKDRDYRVTTDDLRTWEKTHGRIPDGAIVLLRTGFGRFWPDRVRYMGTDARGEAGVKQLHFPGLHADAARWLLAERAIAAVGIDTPSIDHGPSQDFATHVALFARDVPALENVAHLDRLPEEGFTALALPMKIGGGSGGPVRVVAIVGGEIVAR